MSTTQTKLTITVINDHEGTGECSACGRDNLRWVATLSDGSQVGMECSKNILGYRPSANTYNWIASYTPIHTHRPNDCETLTLWAHKENPRITAYSCNGQLLATGNAKAEWLKRGWISA